MYLSPFIVNTFVVNNNDNSNHIIIILCSCLHCSCSFSNPFTQSHRHSTNIRPPTPGAATRYTNRRQHAHQVPPAMLHCTATPHGRAHSCSRGIQDGQTGLSLFLNGRPPLFEAVNLVVLILNFSLGGWHLNIWTMYLEGTSLGRHAGVGGAVNRQVNKERYHGCCLGNP